MADLATILETEVKEELTKISEAAQTEAAGIISSAKEQAAGLIESRKRSLEAEYQAGVVRAKSAASLEVAALRLSAADTVQSRAFELAHAKLEELTQSPEYRTILHKLISEALPSAGDVEAIEVHPQDVALASEVVKAANLTAAVRANPSIKTGVRLVTKGGRTSVVNTLLARLNGVRDTLASQVARTLTE